MFEIKNKYLQGLHPFRSVRFHFFLVRTFDIVKYDCSEQIV